MPIYEEQCRRDGCGIKREYYSQAITEETQPCPNCLAPTDRLHSLATPQFFVSFRTRNLRRDGKEVEVRSAKDLSRMCKENGVVHVPDQKLAK